MFKTPSEIAMANRIDVHWMERPVTYLLFRNVKGRAYGFIATYIEGTVHCPLCGELIEYIHKLSFSCPNNDCPYVQEADAFVLDVETGTLDEYINGSIIFKA